MIQRRLLFGSNCHSFRSFKPISPVSRLQFLRNASTAAAPSTRIRNFIYGSSFILVVSFGYAYATDTRASIHRYIVPKVVHFLYPDAEDAHQVTTSMLKELHIFNLHPRERREDGKALSVEIFGQRLTNPIGISGGLDKHADIPDALFALGPSIVEIGGVTPRPQEGNVRPRVFRIPSEEAIVNRYGLPSEGADVMALRLRQRVRKFAYNLGLGIDQASEQKVLDGGAGVPPGSLTPGRMLAVQIAKNKNTSDNIEDVVADHVYCTEKLGKYADILVVNVSSPNTPGLRSFQAKESLTKILSAVVDTAQAVQRQSKPLVMVKVSPDEDSNTQVQGICDAVWASGVDGVIVGNTTKFRPQHTLEDPLPYKEAVAIREQGGYSGPQLFDRTLNLIETYRKTLDKGPREDAINSVQEKDSTTSQRKVIFASGGIVNGQQAKQVLDAGASVAMVYTTLVYNGAGTISRIKDELQRSRS